MTAILKKELSSYFKSFTGYITAAALVMISGFLFYLRTIYYAEQSAIMAGAPPGMAPNINFNKAILASLPSTAIFIALFFVIPVMTMHIFAEEKKTGTLEMLFTYPITEMQLIAGKYLSCLAAILPGILLTGIFPFFLIKFMPGMDLGYLAAGYTGVILACMAGTAIGMWASSLSGNQIISCIASVGIFLLLWLIGGPADLMTGPFSEFLKAASFANNMENFTKGAIELPSAAYFIGIAAFFIYLTYYNLASRKWRG
ncbi:MAG: ABC transporter permease [bacterium]|nr:ABC transporter permease [bacterium]